MTLELTGRSQVFRISMSGHGWILSRRPKYFESLPGGENNLNIISQVKYNNYPKTNKHLNPQIIYDFQFSTLALWNNCSETCPRVKNLMVTINLIKCMHNMWSDLIQNQTLWQLLSDNHHLIIKYNIMIYSLIKYDRV